MQRKLFFYNFLYFTRLQSDSILVLFNWTYADNHSIWTHIRFYRFSVLVFQCYQFIKQQKKSFNEIEIFSLYYRLLVYKMMFYVSDKIIATRIANCSCLEKI